ncbi:hypothetical protein EB118_03745 [bacterium]|nr:hypothetical protein [bacterium]
MPIVRISDSTGSKPDTSWIAIASSGNHSLAINSAGTLFAWGINSFGQLGDGTTISKSLPVQIGSSSWVAVATGSSHSLAVRSGGTLYSWGLNNNGRLGDGTSISKSSPVQIGSSSWIAVAAGINHSIGIVSGGTLFAWGSGNYGQIGKGYTLFDVNENDLGGVTGPTGTISKWRMISHNFVNGVAIDSNYNLWTWGAGLDGSLGNGFANFTDARNTTSGSTPTLLSSQSWIFCSAGFSTTYAIRSDGMLFAWGGNSYGQLGDSTLFSKSLPVQIGSSSWIAVSAGERHVLAIRSGGTLFGWGRNQLGQVGDGTTINKSSPVQIGGNLSWNAISSRLNNSAAIDSNGKIYTWGVNASFQLGDGTTITRSFPTQIPTANLNLSSWTAVSVGASHMTAIRSDNMLFSWGSNRFGQLGNGIGSGLSNPNATGYWSESLAITYDDPITLTGKNNFSWTSISSGYSYACAIRSDSSLWCWGLNTSFQLGSGDSTFRVHPTKVDPSGIYNTTQSWNAVSAGQTATLAIASDGKLFYWGYENWQANSLPTPTPISVPTLLSSGSSWTVVGTTRYSAAAIDINGRLCTWGDASSRVGSPRSNGQDNTAQTQPRLLATGFSGANNTNGKLAIGGMGSAGDVHMLAVNAAGTLYSWGFNGYGQLGNGTRNNSFITQIGSSSWTAVGAIKHTSYAIRSDGMLFAWGKNSYGQLGIEEYSGIPYVNSPVQIGSSSWTALKSQSINSFSMHAVRSDGMLFGWGLNNYGQLGDGTTINRSSPVQIGSSSWSVVTSGRKITLGIKNSPKFLYSWGDPYSNNVSNNVINIEGGSLRLEDIGAVPQQIGSSSWIAVSSFNHNLGVVSDGTVYGWGLQYYEQVSGSANPFVLNSGVLLPVRNPHPNQPRAITSLEQRPFPFVFTWYAVDSEYNNLVPEMLENVIVPTKALDFKYEDVVANNTYGTGYPVVDVHTLQNYVIAPNNNILASGLRFVYQINGSNSSSNWIGRTLEEWTPKQVGKSGISYISVKAGNHHNLLMTPDNKLWGFGQNDFSQTGKPGGDFYNSGSLNVQEAPAAFYPSLRAAQRASPIQIGDSNTTWLAFSAGASHSTAIRSDGLLFTWGRNAYGQLGDHFETSYPRVLSSPALAKVIELTSNTSYVPLSSSLSWSIIDSRGTNTLAIRSDGKLYSWGTNSYSPASGGSLPSKGQIGDGTTFHRSSPVQIGSSSWIAVSVGGVHCLAIRSGGTLFAWGLGSSGQLGFNDTIQRLSPIQIGFSSWIAVSAGANHSIAIRSGGTLFAWGLGTSGQLGDGTAIGKSSPVQIGSSSWIAIDAGDNHSVAIRSGGTLFAWGLGTSGQLGDGTAISKSSPVQIGSSSWIAISAGGNHNLGLLNNSILYSWGLGSSGQLGDVTTISKSSPVQIGSSSWTIVRSRGDSSYAVRSGGTLFTWGRNNEGQLGDSTTINKSSPVQIGSSSWSAVGSGGNFGVALDQLGRINTWGGSSGTSGTAPMIARDVTTRILPTQIGYSSWTAVGAGYSHTVAVRSDNYVFSWGRNNYGQVGDFSTIDKWSPTLINSSGSSWGIVGTNTRFNSFITRQGGGLFAWGLNSSGQLGIGITTNFTGGGLIPSILNRSSWNVVDAGPQHTLAIRSGGTLFSFGNNAVGQLGDSSTVSKSSPVQIGSSSWTAITTGGEQSSNDYSMGISSNYLYGWGGFSQGQIGNLVSTGRSSPILAGGIANLQSLTNKSWINVSVNSRHVLGITSDYKLWAWGQNDVGQLGDGTTINRNSPVQIGSSSWIAVATGTFKSSLAIKADNTLWKWGNDVTTVSGFTPSLSSPVQIGSSSWSAINAGTYNASAIRIDGAAYMWGPALSMPTNTGTTIQLSPVPVVFDAPLSGNSTVIATMVKSGFTSPHGATNTKLGVIDNQFRMWTGGAAGGNLGDGVNIDKLTVGQIGVGRSWVNMAWIGAEGGAAVDSAGYLYIWGTRINSRDVGYGHADFERPQRIMSSPTVTTRTLELPSWQSFSLVSSGLNTNFAINSSGSLFGWGNNANGILGDGTTISRIVPQQIGSSSWTFAAAGTVHSAAIRSGGTLFTWGLGTNGELGDGTTISKSSPVQIGSSSWIVVAAAANRTAAIRSDGMLFTWGAAGALLGDSNLLEPMRIKSFSGTSLFNYSWNAVSSGASHVSAIRSDGILFTWGSNVFYQLGDGTSINKSSPVQIGSSSWTTVSAGKYTTHAIRSGGTLFGWGANLYGQLGSSTFSPVYDSWTAVSASDSHVLAIKADGTLWAWGSNGSGQLGDGTVITRTFPVQIGSSSWTAINCHATGGFSLGIRSDGMLFAWGSNGNGQLGDGTVISRSSPVQIGSSSWIAIATGNDKVSSGNHCVAIRSGGTLFTWGANAYSQLGDGTAITKSSPVQIGSSSWIAVAAGGRNAAAIRSDNTIHVWGSYYGRATLNTPTIAGGSTSNWTAVSIESRNLFSSAEEAWAIRTGANAGLYVFSYTDAPTLVASGSWTVVSTNQKSIPGTPAKMRVAVRADGTLWGYGLNDNYQLGLGDVTSRTTLTQLATSINPPLNLTGMTPLKLSMGQNGTFLVDGNGSLWVIGGSPNGNQFVTPYRSPTTLANLNNVIASSPVQIGSSSWTAISSVLKHSLGITSGGTLFAWGSNLSGQVGDGTIAARTSPIQIGSSSWTAISAGAYHSLAIRSGGTLFTWGKNNFGQLGNGGEINSSSPTQIGSSSWTAISTKRYHNAAIRSGGTLFAWGRNNYGQIGNSTTTNVYSPVQIGSSSWIAVNTGLDHTLAVRSGGTLFTWGRNNYGQLGDGTQINRSSPVQAGFALPTNAFDNTIWSSIVAGDQFSLGLNSNGDLYSWGNNTLGQLSRNFGILHNAPYQISDRSFTMVKAASGHFLARDVNGVLYSWGDNTFGQLGDGTAITRSSPVVVGGIVNNPFYVGSNNFSFAAGDHSIALSANGGLFTWGRNHQGQLGDGTTINRVFPVLIDSSNTFNKVSVGLNNSFAINSNNALWSWGFNAGSGFYYYNSSGNANLSSPVQIGQSVQGSNISWKGLSVTGGGSHGVAIDSDDWVYSWGATFFDAGPARQASNVVLARWDNRTIPQFVGKPVWKSVIGGNGFFVAVTTSNNMAVFGPTIIPSGGSGNTTIPPPNTSVEAVKQLTGPFNVVSDQYVDSIIATK